MSHDFNYRVDGTALVPTYADNVRLMEGVAARRSQHVPVAYRDGAYVAANPFTAERLMRLDTLLPGGSSSAIYTALHGLKGLLYGGTYLQRNDPALGEVRCAVRVDEPVQQQEGPARFEWRWPVWQLRGHWEATTPTVDTDAGMGATGTIGPLTIGGDHPTYPVFQIQATAAGANPAIEDQVTGDRISLPYSFATNDVAVVDCYENTVLLNGTRITNIFDPNRGWWMRWLPGSHTLDFTSTSGTWTVQTTWRNRWR